MTNYQMPGPTGPAHSRGGWVRRHKILTAVLSVVSLIVLFIVVGAASGGGNKPDAASTGAAQPTAAAAATTQAPAPVASPAGTAQGSCNYDLGNNPAGGTAVATGDIEAANTGNVGIDVRLKLTWPQEGYAPLAEVKTVKLKTGQTKDVQFNLPLSSDELDNLQNWQTGHNYDSGCTYKAHITGTFGPVQG